MSLRFLKKQNGERVLQEYNPTFGEYKDIPMVDETPCITRLQEALCMKERSYGPGKFIILMNKKFHEELCIEHNRPSNFGCHEYSLFNGHTVHIVLNMNQEFKIVAEV